MCPVLGGPLMAKFDGHFGPSQFTSALPFVTMASRVGKVRYSHPGLLTMKVARIYIRVSSDEQDLTRQAEIEHGTRSAGDYIAGVYREKVSGARAAPLIKSITS